MENNLLALSTILVTLIAKQCTAQTTPPKIGCKLNSTSPFSWVVQIVDSERRTKQGTQPGAVAIGTMLTFKSILTSAWYFNKVTQGQSLESIKQRFVVWGHRIWDWERDQGRNARTNPCFQSKKITRIHYHPLATLTKARRVLFDYAVIILDGYFDVSTPTFPAMFFQNSPYELMLGIQYVNVKNELECAVPIPGMPPDKIGLIINDRIDFKNYKFHMECINYLCERPGGEVSARCVKILNNRPNATMLCPRPAWTTTLPLPTNLLFVHPNYYAGTPYICNGSTLGLVTQLKQRSRSNLQFGEPKQDFFLVVTFLRVWAFLIRQLIDNSARLTPFYIETASLRRERFTEPYREPLPYEEPGKTKIQRVPDFKFPKSDARSDTICSILPILSALLAPFATLMAF